MVVWLIYGGLIAGAIVLYTFADRKLINTGISDTQPERHGCPEFRRWGNFFNQPYGAAVDSLDYLPGFIRDQMYIDGSYRQPPSRRVGSWESDRFELDSEF